MRRLLIGSFVAMVALLAALEVVPNVAKCRCHFEWINGALYIVCC